MKIAFQSGKHFDEETHKYNIKDTMSMTISFMDYMLGPIVMLISNKI